MDLDRVQVALRPRNHWEAIDLGVALARRHAGPLYLAWGLVTLPFLAAVLVGPAVAVFWVAMLLWWLKPLFERLSLLQVSRFVFGEPFHLRAALGAWRRGLGWDALAALTWRRLSPTRALDQPLNVLEGLRGRARTERLGLVHRTAGGTMTLTLVLLVHVELVLVLACYAMLLLWVPEGVEVEPMALLVDGEDTHWVYGVIYWLVAWLVGPLHACCGFALYLNRRVELEGWDLEIGFRRLARRLGGVAAALLAGVLLLGGGVVPAGADEAGEGATRAFDVKDTAASRALVGEVLAGDPWHTREEESRLVWPALEAWWEALWQDDGATEAADVPDLAWLADVLQWVPVVLEFLLWVVLASLVIWLVWHYRDWLLAAVGREARPAAPPEALFGLDVTPESLPDDVPAAVHGLLGHGDLRGALALLYRGALVSAMHRHACRFRASDTEAEVLVRARAVLPAEATAAFARLTRAWQQVAYGHRPVPAAEVEAAAAEWQRWFAIGEQGGQQDG